MVDTLVCFYEAKPVIYFARFYFWRWKCKPMPNPPDLHPASAKIGCGYVGSWYETSVELLECTANDYSGARHRIDDGWTTLDVLGQ